jgi:hypothetical protein
MAVVAGRSTGSLERMKNQRAERTSINRHFWREGVIQAAIIPVMVILAAVMAFVGPWLFDYFR